MKLLRRTISYFFVVSYRLPERSLYRIIHYISKLWGNETGDTNVKEVYFKYLRRSVLESKFLSFEEMGARKLHQQISDEEKSQQRTGGLIPSYNHFRNSIKYKNIVKKEEEAMSSELSTMLIIKKQTKLINSLWMSCCLFILNERGIPRTNIFKEFNEVAMGIIDSSFLTLENIDRILDVRSLFKFLDNKDLDSFFLNQDIGKTIDTRLDVIRKAFPDKRKNIRTIFLNKIGALCQTKFLHNQVKIEKECLYQDNIMVDVSLENVVNKKKIGVTFYSLNTDREDLAECPNFVTETEELEVQRSLKNHILSNQHGFSNFYYIKQSEKDNLDSHIDNIAKILIV